jgi:hypothetical protein
MDKDTPLTKSKEQFKSIIDKISSANSTVGIDAQYTHAIIITYLQEITERLDTLEKIIDKQK